MKYYKKSYKKQKKSRKQRAGASISYKPDYEPIITHMDNKDELIVKSRILGDIFMNDSRVNKKVDFWIRKIVTDEIPPDCFGKPDTNNFIGVNKKDLKDIIKMVSQIFKDNDLEVEDKLDITENTNIEVHYAKTGENSIGSGLMVHMDNDGAINGRVHTLIVYLDIDCKGGLLEVYDDTGTRQKYKIDPRSEIKNQTKVVMFNGGMMHRPTPITNGTRLIVTYQFSQKIKTRKGGSKSRKSINSCIPFEDNVLIYGENHGVA